MNYSTITPKMHCASPECFDDNCHGECLEESKGSQEYYEEEERVYSED